MKIKNKKEKTRKEIWETLHKNQLTHRKQGDYGKIPDFKGKTQAAEKLRKTEEYKKAKIIFTPPDTAQKPVRYNCLKDGKTLIMATPNLENGYVLIKNKENKAQQASDKKYATENGKPIIKMPKIDLVIEGSVGVDLKGNRLGKGKGYADREIKYLHQQKSINQKTPIITTIHPLQIKEEIPTDKNDCKINMIITPKNIIYTENFKI